ncbi:FAD-dependent oxidoreductase [Priestia sp. YIM B13448]|uniref:FAD-dependent oxidoreductase n=1 Tax=Priestia sp. YIM B13448 TaxID=3366308 RepID=UPI00366C5CF1
MQHVDVLIIGGGPAGISAAVWCKRLGVAPNVELIKEKVTTIQSGLIVINEVH